MRENSPTPMKDDNHNVRGSLLPFINQSKDNLLIDQTPVKIDDEPPFRIQAESVELSALPIIEHHKNVAINDTPDIGNNENYSENEE